MHVFVNGESREVADQASVADLLQAVSAPQAGIAVEVNRALVRRTAFSSTALSDGDQVEIVGMVGGG